jgi:hypothetical protein
MSTKNTVTLLFGVFAFMELSMWLREKTGSAGWLGLAALLSLVAFGLMLYAASREKKGDKSEPVPPKLAVVMFASVGLWVAFLCYRALH